MTQAQLDKQKKRDLFMEQDDSISTYTIPTDNFERKFPEVQEFLDRHEVESTHTHVFGVPLHRYPGDSVGLKLIFSASHGCHILVDPSSKQEILNARQNLPCYYSHFIFLWHVLILRLFLMDAQEKIPLYPDLDNKSLKASHVLRLVPQLKSSKKLILDVDEKGQKKGSKTETVISFLLGNLMTMLPAPGKPKRQTVMTTPAKAMCALLVEQLYFDTTWQLDKQNKENKELAYQWDTTEALLTKLQKPEFYLHHFKKLQLSSFSIKTLKTDFPEEFHNLRREMCVHLLRDQTFIDGTLYLLNEKKQQPRPPKLDENGAPKKRKLEILGDVDPLDTILEEPPLPDEPLMDISPPPAPEVVEPPPRSPPKTRRLPEASGTAAKKVKTK